MVKLFFGKPRRSRSLTRSFLLASVWLLAPSLVPAADESFFKAEVLPLLESRCFECHSHSAKKLKAGLFLDSRSGMLAGGDSGAAIVPGDLEQSRLIEAIRYGNIDLQMPPKTRLGDDEIAVLEKWVKGGAPWPDDATITSGPVAKGFDLAQRRAEHWAWQPVDQVKPPAVKDAKWAQAPVDAFVLAKLEAAGIKPAAEADRRTLIRRLSLILTGLPPTPNEVATFEQSQSKQAFAELVERLLASPRFGERWARHWLDVVRYSETLGHEFDYAMPNAWRYRDYAIRTFNADIPYDQFVREHIAGDLAEPPRRDPETGLNESALATAYHWFGQQVHSPVDIKGNQLDVIDNQIDTLSRGFQALTVSCARCHDHKFDAISTKDFYALYGVYANTRFAQSDVGNSNKSDQVIEKFAQVRASFADAVAGSLDGAGTDVSGEERRSTAALQDAAATSDALLPSPLSAAWQRSGLALADALVEAGELLYLGPTNSVVRTTVPIISSRKYSANLQGAIRSPSFVITNRFLHVRAAGRGSRVKVIIENFQMIQNPIYGELKKVLDRDDLGWTTFKLGMWPNHIAYLEVLDVPTPDLAGAAGGGVSDDGWFDLAEAILSDNAKAPKRESGFEPVEMTDAIRSTLGEIAALGKELPDPVLAPLVTDSEGVNQPVLVRGGPNKPGEPVARRFLEALGGLEHPVKRGSGRQQVADLIALPENPLTARVWVNRVWHHLFGLGIVPTVDDFGVLGDDPSHPELLDWLANWFVTEGEWSTKKLITLLVTSSTWKQSALAADDRNADLQIGSAGVSKFDQLDPNNILLHKWTVRRLEGEAIRDSVLAVSGRLDPKMYGPPVATHLTDFMTGRGRPGKSGPLDGDGRRSIYLEVRRNFMSPMMLAFDTPQAAQTFGRRARSNVPAQALILLNDPFVQEQAKLWAERLLKETSDNTTDRIARFYEQALQRPPTGEELTAARAFLAEQATRHEPASTESIPPAAWADLGHVLFNTKEFVFVN